jgi:MFS family permease
VKVPIVGTRKIFYGWVIVMASTCVTCTGFGILYSFSVFFKSWIREWASSRAALSAVFSLAFITYGLVSIVMGWLTDRYGPRRVLAAGGVIMAAGAFLTAFCHKMEFLFITWGIMVAIGVGTCYSPTAATVSKWFVHRKGMAMGTIVSGIGLGTLVFSPLSEHLIQSYGWRTAIFVVGLIALTVYVFAALIMRGRPEEMGLEPLRASAGHGHENGCGTTYPGEFVPSMSVSEAIHTRNLWFLFAIHGLWTIGLAVCLSHFVPYATDLGIKTTTAAAMLGSVGAMSILGRLSLGVLTEQWGVRRSIVIILSSQAASMLLPIIGSSPRILWIFVLAFGFGYGGLASIFPLATAEFFGTRSMGSLFGILLLGSTIGGSVGPLLAGSVFDLTGSYRYAFISCVIFMAMGIALAAGVEKTA